MRGLISCPRGSFTCSFGSSLSIILSNSISAAAHSAARQAQATKPRVLGYVSDPNPLNMRPVQLSAALERVRAGADIMPQRQLHQQLREQLGDQWRDKLQSFEDDPLAAASIGQASPSYRVRTGLHLFLAVLKLLDPAGGTSWPPFRMILWLQPLLARQADDPVPCKLKGTAATMHPGRSLTSCAAEGWGSAQLVCRSTSVRQS